MRRVAPEPAAVVDDGIAAVLGEATAVAVEEEEEAQTAAVAAIVGAVAGVSL